VYRRSRLYETCTTDDRSCTSSARDSADDEVVEIEPRQSLAVTAGKRRCGKPTLEDRLIARLLARWLDEELARGVGASLSEAHTVRAEQLTSEGGRRKVARRLDRLVDRAQNPRPAALIPVLPPCREQVRAAMPLIVAVRSHLLSEEPVTARGIARLKILLSDPRGPCYVRSQHDALTVALQDISRLLGLGQMPLVAE
jgi:hypothetical protein